MLFLVTWLESKYASTFYQQMSAKMQLWNKLSEFLHKFVSLRSFKYSCFKGLCGSFRRAGSSVEHFIFLIDKIILKQGVKY